MTASVKDTFSNVDPGKTFSSNQQSMEKPTLNYSCSEASEVFQKYDVLKFNGGS